MEEETEFLALWKVLEVSGSDLTNESPDRSTMLRQGLVRGEKYYVGKVLILCC